MKPAERLILMNQLAIMKASAALMYYNGLFGPDYSYLIDQIAITEKLTQKH